MEGTARVLTDRFAELEKAAGVKGGLAEAAVQLRNINDAILEAKKAVEPNFWRTMFTELTNIGGPQGLFASSLFGYAKTGSPADNASILVGDINKTKGAMQELVEVELKIARTAAERASGGGDPKKNPFFGLPITGAISGGTQDPTLTERREAATTKELEAHKKLTDYVARYETVAWTAAGRPIKQFQDTIHGVGAAMKIVADEVPEMALKITTGFDTPLRRTGRTMKQTIDLYGKYGEMVSHVGNIVAQAEDAGALAHGKAAKIRAAFIATEALLKGKLEVAESIKAYGHYDPVSGTLHALAAADFFATAALAGRGGGGGSSSGGGGGGRGGGRDLPQCQYAFRDR